MSDSNGGYTLNRRGLADLERAAERWAVKWENCFANTHSHESIETAYKNAEAARVSAMPGWIETDEGYSQWFRACGDCFDLEKAVDAAHLRLNPNYFTEEIA